MSIEAPRAGRKLVFVVGAPRSGTTLLQNLLASHPAVSTAPETHFFVHASRFQLYHRNLPPLGLRLPRTELPAGDAQAFIDRLQRELEWLEPGWSRLEPGKTVSLASIANQFFAALGDPDSEWFLEKTPPHAFFIPAIRAWRPDAEMIHLVRDPRDVAASFNGMLANMNKAPRSAYECARVWLGSVEAARNHGLHTVRFEDLVDDPVGVVGSVGERLGLSYTQDMLEAHAGQAGASVREGEVWKARNFGPVDAGRAQQFEKRLDPHAISVIEQSVGDLMHAYGYEPLGGRPDPRRLREERSAYRRMRVTAWLRAQFGR